MLIKSIAVLLVGGGITAGFVTAPPNPPRSTTESYRAFGRSVAIAGEFAFVGEPNVVVGGRGGRGGAPPAAGVVHVYRQTAGAWKSVAELSSATPVSGDGFGASLAADATTLLVGQVSPPPAAPQPGARVRVPQTPPPAPTPDTAVGSVQVFRRGADMKWTSAGTLDATRTGGAQFGTAISMSGDRALVGAPGESGGGAVYLFKRAKDGSWSGDGRLPAQGLVAGDAFGAAIAFDGNRAVVGAPSRKAKGAVFLFRIDSTNTWIQESEQIAPPTIPDNAQFGGAVAVKGDRVIIGAPNANLATAGAINRTRDSLLAVVSTMPAGPSRDSVILALNINTVAARGGGTINLGGQNVFVSTGPGNGVVVVIERASFGSWRRLATLAPFDFGGVQFGASLSVVGDELWIGAPGSDGAGRIYRARADKDGAWQAMTKLGVDTVETGAQWSSSFAVSGNSAIVGMPGDGGGGGTVAFLGRTAANEWTLKSMVMPPVPDRFPTVTGKEVQCKDGMAGAFECSNTGLLSYLPISAIGGKRGVNLSGSWGWTDPQTGRDISIIGRTDGTAFVDVTDPTKPRYLGDLPRTKGANMSSWREIKTYKNYALIVSDGSGDHHGIQIFDLTRLRNVTTPKHFNEDAHFDAGSIHDIAVNEATGFAYAVGTASGGERCSGGSLMIDIKQPLKPKFVGCFADAGTGRARGGYSHDIQCVVYKGPDKRYAGHEICMASNETTVSIQDVTDKKNVKVVAHADYPTPGYTHQGWFTDDHKYWYLNDELDETGGIGKSAEGTRTMIFDVTDLEQPIMVKEYIGPTKASDHNLYVKGDRMYQSNYRAGLRILDISDPKNPKEVGYLDTQPGENLPGFQGSWNNYPFFKNGAIGVVSIGEGFFMVRDATRKVVP
jgi:choice-of-anchor B domain-containing protein